VIVAWGWGITVVILATAIVTLNLMCAGRRLPRAAMGIPGRGSNFQPDRIHRDRDFRRDSRAPLLGRRREEHPANRLSGILLALIFGSRVLPERVQLEILDHFNTRRALTNLAWESSIVFARSRRCS
jgi:hypothetical protein